MKVGVVDIHAIRDERDFHVGLGVTESLCGRCGPAVVRHNLLDSLICGNRCASPCDTMAAIALPNWRFRTFRAPVSASSLSTGCWMLATTALRVDCVGPSPAWSESADQ
jgi:hypothetical protein